MNNAPVLDPTEEGDLEIDLSATTPYLYSTLIYTPFANTESFDLNPNVTGKALDGLFHVLGEEERKVRTNPAARVTGC